MKNTKDPKLNINVRLLRRIQRAILKWPHSFDMRELGSMEFVPSKMKKPTCGSAQCIAGWAYTIALDKPTRVATGGQIEASARQALGLTIQQAYDLFFPDNLRAGPRQAVAAIDRLIKTKGADNPWKSASR